MNKYHYVRTARQTRQHTCHWPGCAVQVPPAMWGCKTHWYMLPQELRDEVWAAYIPGQESDFNPSTTYLDVMEKVDRWIVEHSSNTR